MSRWLPAIVACALLGCGDDIPTMNASTTGSGSGASTSALDTSTGAPPADDTADTTAGAVPEVVLDIELSLEAKRSVAVVLTQTGDALEATVTPSEGFGVAVSDEPLTGPARIDAFPEAGATMYTARLDGPIVPDGPCGDEPISLALALHLDADAAFIAGALTPYCGADTWFGIPPIEPLRISGTP